MTERHFPSPEGRSPATPRCVREEKSAEWAALRLKHLEEKEEKVVQ